MENRLNCISALSYFSIHDTVINNLEGCRYLTVQRESMSKLCRTHQLQREGNRLCMGETLFIDCDLSSAGNIDESTR